VTAAASVAELIGVDVLMAAGTGGRGLIKFQGFMAGTATDCGVPTIQGEIGFGVVELQIRAHLGPVVGTVTDNAIKFERPVRILNGLALQSPRSDQ
jgi:hypothetical protein